MERRIAGIRTLEASAHDDVLDLFDVVVTDMFARAKAAEQQERLSTIRDLDAAALLFRQACAVLLDENTPDPAVRRAVFAAVTRNELAEAIAQVGSLARPVDDQYFKELRTPASPLAVHPVVAANGRVRRHLGQQADP